VRAMHPAVIAELLEFKTVGRLLLILRRDIIPVLALGALQRDVISRHKSSFQGSFARLIASCAGLLSLPCFRLLNTVFRRLHFTPEFQRPCRLLPFSRLLGSQTSTPSPSLSG